MFGRTVLVVEDDSDIRQLLSFNLRREGFVVTDVSTGEEAMVAAESHPPHLILLDLLLPGIDGLTICQKLKTNPRTRSIPVIMLTARGEEVDIVSGLAVGADDYITKPFSPRVLVARVRAVLRRFEQDMGRPGEAEEDADACIKLGDLVIDPGRHEVRVEDERVELTATEFRILRFLVRRPGWVFTRQQILDGIHGDAYAITDRAVDVQIVGLRKKLGNAGSNIETVRGVGYRFKE